VLSEKRSGDWNAEDLTDGPSPSGAGHPESLTPSARGQARGDGQGAASPAREAKASGARFAAPRSAPAGPPRIDATSPRIIRAQIKTQETM
jgi:hypothetical protein